MAANPNIYNLDYKQAGTLLTPPSKRQPNWLAFLNACLSPVQWLRDLVFVDYSNGTIAALYASGTTYSFGQRVVWTDFGVYEYIYAPNGVPASTNGNAPATLDASGNPYWYQTQKNFLGLRTRMKFTSQKITLEYALNTFFAAYGASFVQPSGICNAGGSTPSFTYPDATTPVSYYPKSSIFIGTNTIDVDGFLIGTESEDSSLIAQTDTGDIGSQNYIGDSYLYGTSQYNFTVFVPSVIYNLLTTTFTTLPTTGQNPTIDGLFTSFISQYSVYGLTYKIKRF